LPLLAGTRRFFGNCFSRKNEKIVSNATPCIGFSATPSGTKIVILDMSGGFYNNRNTTAASQQNGKADMAAIETQLKSRGITVIPEATSGVSWGYKQSDKIHLTPEGHKLVATYLLPLVVSALGSSH